MAYKVLIVDDSKLARMAVARALKNCCPECLRVEAASADEALSAMDSEEPSIALVDFNMPGSDGLHLVAELRKLATFLPKPLTEQALTQFIEGAIRELQGAAK